MATGQLDNTERLGEVRRDIARALTILRARDLSEEFVELEPLVLTPARRLPIDTSGGVDEDAEVPEDTDEHDHDDEHEHEHDDIEHDDIEGSKSPPRLTRPLSLTRATRRMLSDGRTEAAPGQAGASGGAGNEAATGEATERRARKVREGTVVSDKMEATVIVAVTDASGTPNTERPCRGPSVSMRTTCSIRTSVTESASPRPVRSPS